MTFIDTYFFELNITQQNIIDGHFAGGMFKSLSMSTMNHVSPKFMNKANIIIVNFSVRKLFTSQTLQLKNDLNSKCTSWNKRTHKNKCTYTDDKETKSVFILVGIFGEYFNTKNS